MKSRLNNLLDYSPWLLFIFALETLVAIILWLADIRIFSALFATIVLSSLVFFVITSVILIEKDIRREEVFMDFLSNPSKENERALIAVNSRTKKDQIKRMARELYKRDEELERIVNQMKDYEDYVETWTHEIKIPLSLLTLLLDNERDTLPRDTIYKLDYVRNQIQENISQILFYYRVRSEKKDFLFENVDLKEEVEEILENFTPLLTEKRIEVDLQGLSGSFYTDRRSFSFILGQIIGNSIKYLGDEPKLWIFSDEYSTRSSITIRDNGCGVKACDINYIFEKGFTGESGQKRKKSTGLGLYLVRKLADNLCIDIEVESVYGEYFQIRLTKNNQEPLKEVRELC